MKQKDQQSYIVLDQEVFVQELEKSNWNESVYNYCYTLSNRPKLDQSNSIPDSMNIFLQNGPTPHFNQNFNLFMRTCEAKMLKHSKDGSYELLRNSSFTPSHCFVDGSSYVIAIPVTQNENGTFEFSVKGYSLKIKGNVKLIVYFWASFGKQ